MAADGRPWKNKSPETVSRLCFQPKDDGQKREKSMFYSYILQSMADSERLYHGHSTNLKQRLADHNAGKCTYTAKYVPWKIKFYAAFETLGLAQDFERYLKSGSGHAFAKRRLGL